MTLEASAEQYDVKVRRDECGDRVVPGTDRSAFRAHIFDGYRNRLGLCLMFQSARRWNGTRRRLEAAGFITRQDGDTEGIMTFDPSDDAQAKLAIQTARVRVRRHLSPERRAVLAAQLGRVPA